MFWSESTGFTHWTNQYSDKKSRAIISKTKMYVNYYQEFFILKLLEDTIIVTCANGTVQLVVNRRTVVNVTTKLIFIINKPIKSILTTLSSTKEN